MTDISPARRFTALERMLGSKAAAAMLSAMMGRNGPGTVAASYKGEGHRMLCRRGGITGGRELNRSRGDEAEGSKQPIQSGYQRQEIILEGE